MLNRRHLRIKVLQVLYAFYQSEELDLLKAEKELERSVERMYDMYLYLILSLPELKRAAQNRHAELRKKMRPTEEDLHPNTKWVDNALVAAIESSQSLLKLAEKRKVNWLGAENQELYRKLMLAILDSEVYFEHLNNGLTGPEEDLAFAVQLFKSEIANAELVQHFFDEISIYWADDLDLCASMAIKTFKNWKEGSVFEVMPLFKENDDEHAFMLTLLKECIKNDEQHAHDIARLADNWELDRIAKMDILLLKMGLTELQSCPSIPTKVSINEYIEISKFYSTPKSNVFINGILDKAVATLSQEKRIQKIGRGLLNQ
ncbi:MAG: transcription antitermination factor NusB [Bacteroidota bacterium]|jgi:N utilization substance protein B